MSNENEWKKAEQGDIIKFTEQNQSLSGKFFSIEESKQYPESYLLKVEKEDESKVGVFVSKIVLDLITTNNIMKGQEIKLVYLGKQKTEDKKREYNNYNLYFR